MNVFRKKFTYGKYKSLKQEKGGVFNGRYVIQLEDYSFKMDMARYITEKVKEIPLPKGRKSDPTEPVTERERELFRSGTLIQMWVARECRFDALGSASIHSHHIKDAVVGNLVEHNKVFAHLKNTNDIGLRYLCLHPSEAVCCIIGDGAGAEQG